MHLVNGEAMDSFIAIGLIFVAPLLSLALGVISVIVLASAMSKRRWLLSGFVAVGVIIFPLGVHFAVYAGCARRCSDLETMYAALLSALAANIIALMIAWVIARSNMTIRL